MKEYGVDLEKQLNHIRNKIDKRFKLVIKGTGYENANMATLDNKINIIKEIELDYSKKSKQEDLFDGKL